jgi:alkylation response protein AidB-like acyl-CoA dehydrogenase
VDFELTADQADLQEGVRKLCEGRFPMERVRSLEASAGVDPDRWRELGDAGVFSLRLAESAGGVGLGAREGVLVFEELGRALVPGPLVASSLAAGLVDGAATGEAVVGSVERDGPTLVVEHLDALDVLVVRDDEGLWSVEPSSVRAGAEVVLRPLDPLTPLHVVPSLPAGERVGGPDEAARWRREGAALTAALQLGSAEATLDAAVAYAKERTQFDRPIGTFQAVKHLLADMLVRVEVARAAVWAAGATLDQPDVGDADRAVAGAKLLADEAALANGKASIQVHGGMGFTWEVDAHLHLKRAWVLATAFGNDAVHAGTLAATL